MSPVQLCSVKRNGLAAVTGCALLLACSGDNRVPDGQVFNDWSPQAEQFLQPGASTVSVSTGQATSHWGCTLEFEHYRAQPSRSRVQVLLAHGFMRDLTRMRGWARHFASHGVSTRVVSLCNSTWFAGRHARNGQDLLALAGEDVGVSWIYAGFSAGGLASLLAARADPHAAGYLGLDSVDSGQLAVADATRFPFPVLLLVAEPSSCNAGNNMLPLFNQSLAAAEDTLAVRIRHASHCHFEDPLDRRCSWVCGDVKPAAYQAQILATIRILATAWLLSEVAEDPVARKVLRQAVTVAGPWRNRLTWIRLPQD